MAYVFKVGDKGACRDPGNTYEVVATDLGFGRPVGSIITCADGLKRVCTSSRSGRYFWDEDNPYSFDLMPPAPTVVETKWANFYGYTCGHTHASFKEAEEGAPASSKMGTLKISYMSDGNHVFTYTPKVA